MPKWRNWQTRYVQGVVSLGLMRVQIPPSALTPLIEGFSIYHRELPEMVQYL